MITDIITWLDDQIADYRARRPLTVHQWVQQRRLRRAVRNLRAYAADDTNPDTFEPEDPQ